MKVRILQMFHDKADYMKVYLVGETVTFDDARAEALIARGLVESAEEKPKEEEPAAPVEEEAAAVEPVEEKAEMAQPLFPAENDVKPVATRRKGAPKE